MMVFAHAFFPFTKFVCLFHMALFFIIAGYFFKDKVYTTFSNLRGYVVKCIKRLWIPYAVTTLILILLHNNLIDFNFYSNQYIFLVGKVGILYGLQQYYSLTEIINEIVKVFYFGTCEQLGGALWFLRVLFFILTFSAIGHSIGILLVKNEKLF